MTDAAAAVPVEREASAPIERRPAWTSTARLADPPVDFPKGVTGVVAHVPAGFDAAKPIHLVLFLHGVGPVRRADHAIGRCDMPAGPRVPGRGGTLHRAMTTPPPTPSSWRRSSSCGEGDRPARWPIAGTSGRSSKSCSATRWPLGLAGHAILDDVADITIVAHSAGHMPLAAILDWQDLDDKVKNVVLLDALYDGRVGTYARWLERGIGSGDGRKLVAIYGDWGRNPATGRAIASRIEARAKASTVVDPPGALKDAIRTHQVTVATWNVDHAWTPSSR